MCPDTRAHGHRLHFTLVQRSLTAKETMRFSLLSVVVAIVSVGAALSAPVLERGNTSVNPAAITGTTCTNKAQ